MTEEYYEFEKNPEILHYYDFLVQDLKGIYVKLYSFSRSVLKRTFTI